MTYIKCLLKSGLAAALLFTVGYAAAADLVAGFKAYNAQDYNTAHQEWSVLADEGDMVAQASLALLYQQGKGVPQDHVRANDLLMKAARQGYVSAFVALGNVYGAGFGVPVDDVAAYKWFLLAAGDDPNAAMMRDLVGATLSEEDRYRAALIAEGCKNSGFQQC